jgi:hypothetical protein
MHLKEWTAFWCLVYQTLYPEIHLQFSEITRTCSLFLFLVVLCTEYINWTYNRDITSGCFFTELLSRFQWNMVLQTFIKNYQAILIVCKTQIIVHYFFFGCDSSCKQFLHNIKNGWLLILVTWVNFTEKILKVGVIEDII